MSKPLFSRRLIAHIKCARRLNADKSAPRDMYFHPTENRIVAKSIDLSSPNPLCEVSSSPGKVNQRNWEERWIEAYIINQAKKNDWRLPLAGKKYRFLSSQLKFRRELCEGEKQGKILDLLLYDEKKKHLIVLELKKGTSKLDTAKGELDDYKAKLEKIIATEKKAIAEAFNLGLIKKDVVGYVVWPANDRSDEVLGLGNYGLIVYIKTTRKPWEEFKEARSRGKDLKIKFECHKPAR